MDNELMYDIDNRDPRTTEIQTSQGYVTIDPVEIIENAVENKEPRTPWYVRLALWVIKAWLDS
jgi:hypothetical protein